MAALGRQARLVKIVLATLRCCGRRLAAGLVLLALASGASQDLVRHYTGPWSAGAGTQAGHWFADVDESQPARLELGGALQLDKSTAPAPKPPGLIAAAAARRPLPPYAPTAPPAVEAAVSTSPADHRRPSPTGPPLPA